MRISPSVVSYRVQCLEEHLGCLLLTRTTRNMSLTDAGRQFYDNCVDVLAAVEAAEKSVEAVGASPRGVLRVAAPCLLGSRVVAPLIPQFRERHSETSMNLRLSDSFVDLVQESIDIAVRMSVMADSSFTLRKVAEIQRVLCASPGYLDGAPPLEKAADLLNHSCLLLRFPGSEQFRWTLSDGDETVTLPVAGPLDADNGEVLTQWALDGFGIVMKPLFEVAPLLAERRLVQVLPEACPVPVTLGLLYPSRKLLPNRAKTFINMATEAIRKYVSQQLALLGRE
ncbi:Transcriptional regulator LysR family [Methylorubrum populi]|uniref:Transcriptional regulator LysR family n=2 Tax=Methylorubrum populi TaxID=223967 RepID=A0A833MYQ7_9HYPH|nr:Transcriptional regulator LysR family [Methylorubrum populi]